MDQIRKKNCFCRQSENFPFSLFIFKNALKLQKRIIFLAKERKTSPKILLCCNWNGVRPKFVLDAKVPNSAAIGTMFSLKFVLNAKVQNSVFWNMLYLVLCYH